MAKEWFSEWFDTPFYHILYKHRNDEEAQEFMRNITTFLKLKKGSYIADLPCGKGRHSIFLNSLGYKVTGGDLSPASIEHAKKFENKSLDFEVWDMRKPLQNKYDAVFNLFTSFGYFEDDTEDLTVLKSLKKGLKKDAVLVLDFMNVEKVQKNLIKEETKTIDGITFNIKREIKNNFILKHINFTTDNQEHNYTERVKFIDLKKFEMYFETVGLKIIHTFGDYTLNPYNPSSDRLIIVAK